MNLLGKVAVQLAGLLLTALLWRRYGLIGVLAALPIAFAVGWFGAAAKQRWRQR